MKKLLTMLVVLIVLCFAATSFAATKYVTETLDICFNSTNTDQWFNATDAMWIPTNTPFDFSMHTNGTAGLLTWFVQRSTYGIGFRHAEADNIPEKKLYCNGNSTFKGDATNGTCKIWQNVIFPFQVINSTVPTGTFTGEGEFTVVSGPGAWYRIYVSAFPGANYAAIYGNATNGTMRVYR